MKDRKLKIKAKKLGSVVGNFVVKETKEFATLNDGSKKWKLNLKDVLIGSVLYGGGIVLSGVTSGMSLVVALKVGGSATLLHFFNVISGNQKKKL